VPIDPLDCIYYSLHTSGAEKNGDKGLAIISIPEIGLFSTGILTPRQLARLS
jgi:hypothetical protein